MRRESMAVLIAASLLSAVGLSSCGAPGAAPTATIEPSESPAVSVSFPNIVPMGDFISADLNGDGEEESVLVSQTEDGLEIKINGTEMNDAALEAEFYCPNPDPDHYCITDLDAADGVLELAIMDWGPSSDYVTNFLRYDGERLEFIGSVPGLIYCKTYGNSDIVFRGDGILSSYVRLGVLQTWFAPVDWRLGEDDFELVTQDIYYSQCTSTVTALQPVLAYTERDAASEAKELAAGATLSILGTDNAEWVLVAAQDAQEYWLHLANRFYIETPDGFVNSAEALEGLNIAD